MSTDITPDILAALKEEEHYVAATRKSDRRVKLEKGHTWKLRFLPAKLGPRKTWYARIARHWVNLKPIVCPVKTHPDFGGDPEAYCPACEMSGILNDSTDEAVSQFGYRSRAAEQWITYCIVFDKNGDEVDGSELLTPYEFAHYVNTWEELKGFFKGTCTKKNPLSVLDYRLGNLFAVTKAAKGLRLDKLDQCSIFDDSDPNFEEYVKRIEANIKMAKIVIPTQQQLEVFAQKMEEAAYKTEGTRERRRPTLDPLEENDTDDEVAPVAKRPSPKPTITKPTQVPVKRPRPITEEPEDNVPMDDPVEEATAEEVLEQPVEAPKPRPIPASRTVPLRPVAASGRKLPPLPTEALTAADEGAEEEQLPEEATDTAPPSEAPDEDADELPPPPPPVAHKGAQNKAMADAIKSRVAAIRRRETAP